MANQANALAFLFAGPAMAGLCPQVLASIYPDV